MVDRLYGKGAAQSEKRVYRAGTAARHPPLGEHLDSEVGGSISPG